MCYRPPSYASLRLSFGRFFLHARRDIRDRRRVEKKIAREPILRCIRAFIGSASGCYQLLYRCIFSTPSRVHFHPRGLVQRYFATIFRNACADKLFIRGEDTT